MSEVEKDAGILELVKARATVRNLRDLLASQPGHAGLAFYPIANDLSSLQV